MRPWAQSISARSFFGRTLHTIECTFAIVGTCLPTGKSFLTTYCGMWKHVGVATSMGNKNRETGNSKR